MKRDLVQLARNEYDLLVIGGGIYGACIARDAALRGLSVALVDKGDFGHATSANSLKIIHGGLRYLQDANLRRMRTMACERTIWMRIAPHLIHPMPCLIPTAKKLTRSRIALRTALWMNDLVSYDRNKLKDPQKHLPKGLIISRDACSRLLPGLAADGLTGGAIWYDAQMYNSERLLLSFILSAVENGAEVANYVEVTNFLGHEKSVGGVIARDVLTDQTFEIRAKVVVNSAGAWVDSVLARLDGPSPAPKFYLSTAINLVTRQLLPKYAVGVSSNHLRKDGAGTSIQHSRILFIVPWRQYSLIGTMHAPYPGVPQDYQVTEESFQDFIDEVNTAYPGANLTYEDVYHIHSGFLPMSEHNGQASAVKLAREGQVYDHEQEDGITGLITVVGVKYTTARKVAEKVVDLTVKKLGRKFGLCQTHKEPVYGGYIDHFDDFLAQATAKRPYGLSPETIEHLVYTYGSGYGQVLKYLDENPAWGQPITEASPVIKAEVIYATRKEMVQKLSDAVQRRTELGAAGIPAAACLRDCADLVSAELGWDRTRREREIDEVRTAYATIPTRSSATVGAN